jgi:hypothetical protein
MQKLVFMFALAIASLFAHSQPTVVAFSHCLEDSTTGRDRKDLARWFFTALGAHPELRGVAAMPLTAKEGASRTAGHLFTRLVTEACATEAREAVREVGPAAFGSATGYAFGALGQQAMRELISDKDVTASLSLMQKYVDDAKLQKILSTK